jgi:SWI/SNF-related matrix-associated actin-dependent regulator 1 of chromatin subfamily A
MKQATLINNARTIKITFDFDWSIVAEVKRLPGRRFHGAGKHWTCSLTIEAVEMLKNYGFELSPNLSEFLKKSKTSPATEIEQTDVPGLKMELFPFQKRSITFIETKNGRALIADQMGLGKTCQSLAWCHLHPEKRPVIIVVPASLKLNWEQEIEKWLPNPTVQILYGTLPNKQLTGEFIIINYDVLPYWLDQLISLNAAILITDEGHYYKNNKAKRTRAVKRLSRRIPHIIVLTGTPIMNRPIEIYNAIKIIDPTVVSNRMDFALKYCDARYDGFGWNFDGASNTQELHERLTHTIMIRRKKSDVLKDLPPKIRSYVPLEIDNQDEYDEAEKDFIHWLAKKKGAEAAKRASNAEMFVKVEMLKQITIKGKINRCIQWVKDFLEVEDKLVIFTTHTSTIDALINEFGKLAVKVDGSVTNEKRNQAVQQFQNNNLIKLFIGNIQAAGIGITLTAASAVAFVELDWVVGNHTQAEDRIHRIGQKAESINIYYLIAVNTIEEKLIKLLEKKAKVLDSVLDGKPIKEPNIFQELIDEIKNETN